MINANKTDKSTSELVSSQWVGISELTDNVASALGVTVADAKEVLLVNAVFEVRPLLVERSGLHNVYRDDEKQKHLEDMIRVLLGESSNHHTEETCAAAHYSHVAFSLPALYEWLKARELNFSIPGWNDWMKSSYKVLSKRGLLVRPANASSDRPTPASGSGVLCFSDLQLLSGYKTNADIVAWLQSNEVPYKTGIRNRPFTTLEAMNQSFGLSETSLPIKLVVSV